MKVEKIFNIVKTFLCKNSPYILSGIGAASVATGAVILVKKAKKQNDFDEEIETIYEERKQGIEVYGAANEIPADKREKVYRKNIVKLNIWKVGKYTRYYATPVILISGGMICMISAMLIQTKRLKALSVAYTSLATAFNDYRDKVKEKLGETEEQDLYEGTTKDKKGNIVEVKNGNCTKNETTFSRLFGEGNSEYWTKNTRICVTILKAAESNLNVRLRSEGFVTLNQVWEELGLKPSSEGMYIGWRFKQGDPIYGSTYISLGYSGPKNEEKCNYLRNCWGEEMWIDVIPPHVLLDMIPKERIRTEEEKVRIKENRSRMPLSTTDSDSRYLTDYDIQKAMTNKINKNLKRAAHIV